MEKDKLAFQMLWVAGKQKKILTTYITIMQTKEEYAKVKTNLNKSERNCQCLGSLRRLHNSLTHMFMFLGLLFGLLGFLIPLFTLLHKI